MPKINTTAIFAIFLFVCVIFTAINYHNIDALESRINTVKKYYKYDSDKFKSERLFKEDYYIIQQERDTTLLLAVFGAVGILVTFLTYQNVISKFETKTAGFDKEMADRRTEMYNELTDIKLSAAKDVASLTIAMSNDFYKKGDKVNYLHYTLWGLSKYTDVGLWACEKYKHEEDVSEVTKSINEITCKGLKIVIKKIGDELEVKEASLDSIENFIEEMRKINDREVNKLLSSIQSRLKQI